MESLIYTINGGGDVNTCIATARAALATDRQFKPALSAKALDFLEQVDYYARGERHPRVVEDVEDDDGRVIGTKVVDEGGGVQGIITVTFVDFGALATPPRT